MIAEIRSRCIKGSAEICAVGDIVARGGVLASLVLRVCASYPLPFPLRES